MWQGLRSSAASSAIQAGDLLLHVLRGPCEPQHRAVEKVPVIRLPLWTAVHLQWTQSQNNFTGQTLQRLRNFLRPWDPDLLRLVFLAVLAPLDHRRRQATASCLLQVLWLHGSTNGTQSPGGPLAPGFHSNCRRTRARRWKAGVVRSQVLGPILQVLRLRVPPCPLRMLHPACVARKELLVDVLAIGVYTGLVILHFGRGRRSQDRSTPGEHSVLVGLRRPSARCTQCALGRLDQGTPHL